MTSKNDKICILHRELKADNTNRKKNMTASLSQNIQVQTRRIINNKCLDQ